MKTLKAVALEYNPYEVLILLLIQIHRGHIFMVAFTKGHLQGYFLLSDLVCKGAQIDSFAFTPPFISIFPQNFRNSLLLTLENDEINIYIDKRPPSALHFEAS